MTAYQHCSHGGKPCPRVIQAIPLASAEPSRPKWPTLIVGGFVLGIAVLEGVVPAIVRALP